jgi:hypothetical protein
MHINNMLNTAFWFCGQGQSAKVRNIAVLEYCTQYVQIRCRLQLLLKYTIVIIKWLCRLIDWLWWGETVSELRPPTGLSFIPRVICETMVVMMMMPAGDNSWLVHQSSLAVLPADTCEASRRNGRRSENFVYSLPEIPQGIFNTP